jgi:hypothetical protein
MDKTDDVLQQANKLMLRHRSFVAGAATEPPPAETDDLPVLTEVVDAGSAPVAEEPATAPLPPDRIEALARELLFDRLPVQREALANEMSAWLDQELPQVVMRVLDGLADQMIAQVTAEARAALLPRMQAALEEESQPPARPG